MDQTFKLTEGYRSWLQFVNQIREVLESLQDSKRTQRQLVVRCNQLKAELVASGKKLQIAMRVRAEDETTMALLRKECDRAVRTSMDAQRKEKEAQKLMVGLQADIKGLQAQVGVLQSALWLERERAILEGATTNTGGCSPSTLATTATSAGRTPLNTREGTPPTARAPSPISAKTKPGKEYSSRLPAKAIRAEKCGTPDSGGGDAPNRKSVVVESLQQREALIERNGHHSVYYSSDYPHGVAQTTASSGTCKAKGSGRGNDKLPYSSNVRVRKREGAGAAAAFLGLCYRDVEQKFYNNSSLSQRREAEDGVEPYRFDRELRQVCDDSVGHEEQRQEQVEGRDRGASEGLACATPFERWKRERGIWYPEVAATVADHS